MGWRLRWLLRLASIEEVGNGPKRGRWCRPGTGRGYEASSDVILGAGTDDGLWPVRSQPSEPAIWIHWGARSSAFLHQVCSRGSHVTANLYPLPSPICNLILFCPSRHFHPSHYCLILEACLLLPCLLFLPASQRSTAYAAIYSKPRTPTAHSCCHSILTIPQY